MPAEAVWSHHHEVVGDVGSGHGNVRLWVVDPELREIYSIVSHDREARPVGDIETCCADNCGQINNMRASRQGL